VLLRPFPVFVSCQGCLEFGQAAGAVALLLERRGYGEDAWLGATPRLATIRTKVGSRFPIYSLDGCAKGCAQRWLAEARVAPQRCFVLSEAERADTDRAARRIAGGL
jgi:uncharacterized metal-binding protein